MQLSIAYQKLKNILKIWLRKVLLSCVLFYRACISPHFGGSCRFEPSCSKYAQQALIKQDLLSAIRLIFKRLLKCRPFGPQGFDPVPMRENKNG